MSKPEPLEEKKAEPVNVAKPHNTNKYARKEKIQTVGLRNLKVTHN